MALVGFPNQIEVIAGSGWNSILTPDETLILTKTQTAGVWTENGTTTPSPTNRIWLAFLENNARARILASYSANFVQNLGYASSGAVNYTFLDIWSGGLTKESWYGAIASGSNYNPDVFSLMREYGAEPPAGGVASGKRIMGGGIL